MADIERDPAFPVAYGDDHTTYFGISVCDYFAAKAMQGLLTAGMNIYEHDMLVKMSYKIAGAMLEERERETP